MTTADLDALREIINEAAEYAGPTDETNARLWRRIDDAEKALAQLDADLARLRRLADRWDSPVGDYNATDAANDYTQAVRALG